MHLSKNHFIFPGIKCKSFLSAIKKSDLTDTEALQSCCKARAKAAREIRDAMIDLESLENYWLT